jgi:hypothetical protein
MIHQVPHISLGVMCSNNQADCSKCGRVIHGGDVYLWVESDSGTVTYCYECFDWVADAVHQCSENIRQLKEKWEDNSGR